MNVKELIQCLMKYPMDSKVFLMEEKKVKNQERLYTSVSPLNDCKILYTTLPGDKSHKPCVQINYTDYSKL